LTTIDAFFASIKRGWINTAPPLGQEIDFFQKNLNNTILVSATFDLSAEERKELFSDVSEERPQVRNLLENISAESGLVIAVCFKPSPTKFAYVRSIDLLAGPTRDTHKLYEVGDQAAKELYDSATKAELADAAKESLDKFNRTFDSEEYTRAKRSRFQPDVGPPLDYYLRRSGADSLPSSTRTQITTALESAENYTDFVTQVSKLLEAISAEITTVNEQPIKASIKTFSGEENVVPQYVKRLLARIADTKIQHFKERRIPIGSDEAKRLLALKIRRGGTEALTRIQTTVNELLGVKVDAFEGPPGRRGENTAELDVDQFLIQVNGSGIREALRLILDTEFERPRILLVEEPEIHLHPALETSVMSYLREVSKTAQVFITTHSTNFLDTGNFENVFLVAKDDSSTVVSPITLAEAEEKLPSELGIRLSSLFMYDQIIFVEGPSDEQIIREFARSLGVNFGQLNLGFVQMRGVRNIGHYAAAEVVSFLTKRRVRLWFLVDSDESTSVHFSRLKEDFGTNAQLHILKKREIENYLLSAKANIRHLIARKRAGNEKGFEAPTESNFQAQLNACAEALKPLTIWKRVRAATRRPVYPGDDSAETPATCGEMKLCAKKMLEDMQGSIGSSLGCVDKICADAESQVESSWQTDKFGVVPGSALLDEVYKKYGLRYDKMRDGVAVAAQMNIDEIDVEIRSFIKRL
jgi:hypothetical protein